MNLPKILPIALSLILVSFNINAQWQPQGIGLLPDEYTVLSISVVDEKIVWAVAANETWTNYLPKVLRTIAGGDTWEMKDVEEATGKFSIDIFGMDEFKNPTGYVEKDWNAEPWAWGCPVGMMAPGAITQFGDALRAPAGAVHWAGTETATEWQGYMNGAIVAGQRAAKEIIGC